LLFQRLVIEIEVDPEGRLRPRAGATWRSEPARNEAAIHRRFATLSGASAGRIAAFASVHGLLRRHTASVLSADPRSAETMIALGHQDADDSIRVADWIERGAPGAPPAGTEDTVAIVALYASLPDIIFDAFEAILDGTVQAAAIEPADFLGIAARAATGAGSAALPFLADPGRIRALDPTRVRRALRMNEWASRVFAGLEEVPDALAAIGGPDDFVRQFMTNLPEAYAIPELLDGPHGPASTRAEELVTETVSDWHAAARDIGAHVRGLDLIRGALRSDGLTAAEKRDLAGLYADLAAYRSPLDPSAAEIAERTRPLLARRIESEIATIDSWPIRRAALAGLYARALIAAWHELTDALPPIACATAGCHGTVPPIRNRRYCDQCQIDRRREAVRQTRSRQVTGRGSG
jgi:hypothetical protein